jgi:hypothetical protein
MRREAQATTERIGDGANRLMRRASGEIQCNYQQRQQDDC